MPIVSKKLNHAHPQRNGTWNVREDHLDSKGRTHEFSYNAASIAKADATMVARDMSAHLREVELESLRDHLEDGGAIRDFTFVDVAEGDAKLELRARLAKEQAVINEQKSRLDGAASEIDNPRDQ